MVFHTVISPKSARYTCLVRVFDLLWPTCCPIHHEDHINVSTLQSSNSHELVEHVFAGYNWLKKWVPLTTLFTRPSSKAKLYLKLLSDETPSVKFETLVEQFKGSIFGLGPWPLLSKAVLWHSFIDKCRCLITII